LDAVIVADCLRRLLSFSIYRGGCVAYHHPNDGGAVMKVTLGVEVLLDEKPAEVRGARLGAVVHPASVLSDLSHVADALQSEDWLDLRCLFGPQHGARGEKQDNMIESPHYHDPETGLPVFSLYSETRKPTGEMLDGIDVLLFDLQDVGTRVYTFIHTLAHCMESCAEYSKPLVVLDRPNPIGGEQVEGNLLDPDCRSFVGLYPIPMRHGMTVGEMARLLNGEFAIGCQLTVVPMRGWARRLWFDQTGLPWIPPSPNIPTLDTAIVYPGMVLVEGTRLSEGRGTTRPFELAGAPYVRPRELAGKLRDWTLPGVSFRPCHFEPTFHKFAGEMCGGVQLHVSDRDRFEPYLTGIALLSAVSSLYPDQFAWRDPPYEYEYRRLPIEILCGNSRIPESIRAGEPPMPLRDTWMEDVHRFGRMRLPYLLYD